MRLKRVDAFAIPDVEHNRVLAFPAAEFFYEGPDVATAAMMPHDQLIQPALHLP